MPVELVAIGIAALGQAWHRLRHEDHAIWRRHVGKVSDLREEVGMSSSPAPAICSLRAAAIGWYDCPASPENVRPARSIWRVGEASFRRPHCADSDEPVAADGNRLHFRMIGPHHHVAVYRWCRAGRCCRLTKAAARSVTLILGEHYSGVNEEMEAQRRRKERTKKQKRNISLLLRFLCEPLPCTLLRFYQPNRTPTASAARRTCWSPPRTH